METTPPEQPVQEDTTTIPEATPTPSTESPTSDLDTIPSPPATESDVTSPPEGSEP